MKTATAVLVLGCLSVGCPRPLTPRPAPVPSPTSMDAALPVDAAPPADAAPDAAIVDAAAPDAPPDDAPTAAPTHSAPRLEYAGGETGVWARGFPALSADGATLLTTVTWHTPGSGARCVVQLRVARTGAVRRTLVLVGPAEAEEVLGGEVPPALEARLRARVATATAALDALQARSLPLVASQEGDDEAEGDDDPPTVATGSGWSLSLRGEQLSVRRGDAGGPVALRARTPRMTEASPRCGGVNTPTMAGFYVVAPDRLLVSVRYHGNDSCWEGPDTWMVVAPR